ncbi:ROK family protein [uncultured Limosilactobacillus sp.]|uniref:ROK family protein n=1 Tax=uncultured Limosilactobacillus sp. TaxID=2837629 RepID=UPI0025F5929A|nr:ROK family protein [uncultured Limosilactobacillus sp.]
MNYLSIDVGGTNLKYALISAAGQIIEKDKIKTPQDRENFLQALDQIVEQYHDQIKGLAFCAPGQIEKTTIHFGGALPFLDGLDLKRHFHELTIPIIGLNDGKAAALAENWLGSLKGEQNCAAIVLGTGVGSGIIVNGHLVAGSHYQAGELSFVNLNYHASDFNDAFVGGIGSAVEMIKRINQVVGNDDETDGLKAFQAIEDGNAAAQAILNDYCYGIATLIMNVQFVVDLDKYAIGGGISAQSKVIQGIRQAYQAIFAKYPIIQQTFQQPEIVAAKFNNDANLYGALYNLLLTVNGETLD